MHRSSASPLWNGESRVVCGQTRRTTSAAVGVASNSTATTNAIQRGPMIATSSHKIMNDPMLHQQHQQRAAAFRFFRKGGIRERPVANDSMLDDEEMGAIIQSTTTRCSCQLSVSGRPPETHRCETSEHTRQQDTSPVLEDSREVMITSDEGRRAVMPVEPRETRLFHHHHHHQEQPSLQSLAPNSDIEEMTRILQSLSAKQGGRLFEKYEDDGLSLASFISETTFSFSSSSSSSSCDSQDSLLSEDEKQQRNGGNIDSDDNETSASSFTIDPSIDSCQSTITGPHFTEQNNNDNDDLSFLYPVEPWETLSD